MGLDIVCGALGERVGSYSGVQRQRIAWIRSEARRQESINNKSTAKAMRETILSTQEIDYSLFEKTDGWLEGTQAFVNHSDCDGTWDPDEAAAILEAVQTLKPFFEAEDLDYYFYEDGSYYLDEILRHSVTHNQDIVFC